MRIAKMLLKLATLFVIGGTIYVIIELLYRGYSHISMFVLGGLAFVLIGAINECFLWETPFWLQCIVGTVIILILEFIFGCILNLWLKLNIWDYSNVPFNILGQVCLPFAFAWLGLTAVAIVLDDYLRYWLFKEEKPRYCWTFKEKTK